MLITVLGSNRVFLQSADNSASLLPCKLSPFSRWTQRSSRGRSARMRHRKLQAALLQVGTSSAAPFLQSASWLSAKNNFFHQSNDFSVQQGALQTGRYFHTVAPKLSRNLSLFQATSCFHMCTSFSACETFFVWLSRSPSPNFSCSESLLELRRTASEAHTQYSLICPFVCSLAHLCACGPTRTHWPVPVKISRWQHCG